MIYWHGITKITKDIFKKNEYPQFFIDECTENYESKFFVPKWVIHTVDKKQVLSVLSIFGTSSF